VLPPMGTLSCWAAAVIFAPVTTGFRCPAFQVDILRVIGNRRRAEGRSRQPSVHPARNRSKMRRHFQETFSAVLRRRETLPYLIAGVQLSHLRTLRLREGMSPVFETGSRAARLGGSALIS